MVAAAMMMVERVAAAMGVVKEAAVRVMVWVCHWRWWGGVGDLGLDGAKPCHSTRGVVQL